MTKKSIVAVVLISFALIAAAKKPPPLSAQELAKITERGRLLAEADAAASLATDVVVASKPESGAVKRYIAQKLPDGWHVAFGHWNEARDKFLIVYETTQVSASTIPGVKKLDPPQEALGFYLQAARAIETALPEFQGANRPYNIAVLPAGAEGMFVYLVPAQTQKDVYPYGGDVRFLISAEGTKIVEKRQLHKSVFEFRAESSAKVKTEAGVHTHILSDVPEDSDVYYVLQRKPPVGEFVGTANHVYEVMPDGTIKVSK